MKYMKFLNQIKTEGVRGGYFIFGEDLYFQNDAEKRIVEWAKLTMMEVNFSKFEMENLQDFVNSAFTSPFFDEFRVSVLDIDKITMAEMKSLAEKLKGLPDFAIVIVHYRGRDRELAGFVEVDCQKEERSVLLRWITSFMSKKGLTISQENAGVIATRLSEDMLQISKYCEILSLYAKEEKEIAFSHIEDILPYEISVDSFSLVNAIGAKKKIEAIKIYEKMRINKIEETKIIAQLYSSIRRMFFISISGMSIDEASAIFKVKPYAVKMSLESARKFSKAKLKKAMDILQKAEENIKMGKARASEVCYATVLKLIAI